MGKKLRKQSIKGEGVKTRAKFRSSPEWKDWRLQVLERDGNRCTCCGLVYPSPRLQCHHKALHAFERKIHSKKRAFTGDHNLVELVQKYFI